jgi:hypothetical protein
MAYPVFVEFPIILSNTNTFVTIDVARIKAFLPNLTDLWFTDVIADGDTLVVNLPYSGVHKAIQEALSHKPE